MAFAGHGQPARGGEVERAGIALKFAQHEGKVAAAQPFFQREQRVLGFAGDNVDHPRAQAWRQAGDEWPPFGADRGRILHPQPMRARRRAGHQRKTESKAGGCPEAAFLGKDLLLDCPVRRGRKAPHP